MVYFKENVSQFSEGFHRFQRGGGRGVKMPICIETYRTYDF